MILSIISAIGRNNEIGKANTLLWDLPADMKHFKETTSGHTVVMGQRTFESLGKSSTGELGKPLPKRRNIIITLDKSFRREGIEIVNSVEELEELFKNTTSKDEEVFIIGGGQIYKLFIDKADKLYITHVDISYPDADTFFPVIDMTKWKKTKIENHLKDDENVYNLEFAEYTRE